MFEWSRIWTLVNRNSQIHDKIQANTIQNNDSRVTYHFSLWLPAVSPCLLKDS